MSEPTPFIMNAPPEGISASEQNLESRIWRIQLDLASGGMRSMLVRTGADRHELADPEAPLHPFQIAGPGGVSRFNKARIRFDPAGASLAVESDLSGTIWRTVFRVEAAHPGLCVTVEGGADVLPETGVILPFSNQSGSADGWKAGGADWMSRTFSGFQLVVAGDGIRCRPEQQRVDLTRPGTPARLMFQSAAEGDCAAEKAADELGKYLRMRR